MEQSKAQEFRPESELPDMITAPIDQASKSASISAEVDYEGGQQLTSIGFDRKDKKLDAGDVVSFDRETHQDANLQRLFINYRRKPFSATALSPGMSFSVKCPLQLLIPFQFPSDAIGGTHVQQQLLSFCLSLFWPASNRTGESSRDAGETLALHANAQPNDLRNNFRFLTTVLQVSRSGWATGFMKKPGVLVGDLKKAAVEAEFVDKMPERKGCDVRVRSQDVAGPRGCGRGPGKESDRSHL